MNPAAVLGVIVRAQGVARTNAQLKSVHAQLKQVDAQAAASTKALAAQGVALRKTGESMQRTGRSMTKFITLPVLAMGAASAKAAIDFEDSFAEVRKTVEATEPQFKRLEKGFRGLAKQIPISVNELNRLGGMAGALGIKNRSLLSFVKTAAELGTTTDLSSEEAANALARLSNIMGTSEKDFRRLASTFVELGNKGASTEQEIASMSLRLASAGKAVGLSEAQVMGFSSALASVGIEAEAGGSAMSRAFIKMAEATASGGSKLQLFAKVAGMTTGQFKKAFKDNAALAMIEFTEGLERVRRTGGNLFGVMDKLGFSEVRVGNALRAAATSGGLFREALKIGSKEWKRNTALTNEARKRYETVASQLEILKNRIIDVGISIGEKIVPAFITASTAVVGMVEAFDRLPDPTQDAILTAAAFAATLGPLVWIMGKVVSGIGGMILKLAELRAMQQAGTLGATNFARGMKFALPAAIAAIQIGSIIEKATSGDMKAAGFEAGGALVGGIAGAVLGKSPQAAMIGSALGQMAGGAIGSLFGGGGKDFTAFQENIRKSSGRVKHALQRQQAAAKALHMTEGNLRRNGKAQRRVRSQIVQAEQHLTNMRRRFKGGSPQVIGAENRLAILKQKNIRLTRQQSKMERLHGIQLWAFKEAAKAAVLKMKERIGLLSEERRKSVEKLRRDKKEGASAEQIAKDLRRWSRVSKDLREEKGRLGAKMGEIARVAGGKFARSIKNMSWSMLRTGKGFRQTEGAMRRMTPSITPIGQLFKEFGTKAERGTSKAKRGVKDLKGVMGPFQSETRRSMDKARKDVERFSGAATKAVEKPATALNNFAGQLGIKNVTFGVRTKKSPKKAKGGMVVPGSGAGDKVPLTAMVEPGEVVHVLNKRAAADRGKLAALETLNRQVPRFATGGSMFVDPRGPGTGVVNRAIADVVGSWSTRYNAAINYGYDPGGGHQSPGHNVTGTATDTGPAAGWLPAPIRLFEQGLRSIQGKVDQILYGTAGIGESYPNHGRGNHAHIEWGMHPTIQGLIGAMIPKMLFTGPEQLRSVGQGVSDKAVQMANKKLQQLVGASGGADMGSFGGEGTLSKQQLTQLWRTANGFGDANLMAAIALAESGGNPRAVGPATTSGHAKGLWQIMMPLHDAIVQGNVFDPFVNAKAAGTILKDQGLGAWEAYTNGNYSQFLQKGGSIQKGIKQTLKGLAQGKRLPKYRAALKRIGRRVGGIGISDARAKRLGGTTADVERFAEYAQSASGLTTETEDGQIIQGLFKGKPEGAWLNEQLNALMKLRGEVIGTHGVIEKRHLPRVVKLLQSTKARLRRVRKLIREAEIRKRKLERKIDEIEQANKRSKATLEKEINQLENQLRKAENAKHPNRQHIDALRGQIKTRKEAMSGSDKASNKQIKDIRKDLKQLQREQNGRRRVEAALKDRLIPTLEGQRTGMHETMASLFGDGGTIKGANFFGLKQIQGMGIGTGHLPNPPSPEEVGGELHSVTARLRQIAEEARRSTGTPEVSDTAEELLAIEKELSLKWKKAFVVSQAQFKVLGGMPVVGAFARGTLGLPASGLALVGEHGPELAALPRRTAITPAPQTRSLMEGGITLVIEQLVIESDGTAKVVTSDGSFEAKVKSVTRKQSRRASRPSPGSR